MKRLGMVLAIAVLAGTILSGCVIVPWDGYYGYHGGHGYYRGHPGPYYRGR